MDFDKQWYEDKFRELLNYQSEEKFFIRESDNFFKIRLFREKGLESFRIASFLLSIVADINNWAIIIRHYI